MWRRSCAPGVTPGTDSMSRRIMGSNTSQPCSQGAASNLFGYLADKIIESHGPEIITIPVADAYCL